MKQKFSFPMLFLLTLLALPACVSKATPISSPPTVVFVPVSTAIPPTLTPTPTATAVPPTLTPMPTATIVPPTATPVATATTVPANTATPVSRDPVVITNDVTNVRHGPSLAYQVSHVLPADTTAPILGRNNAGDWWAVPGPGDGPGPVVGWVSDIVVTVQGNVSNVPILLAPPLTPDVPVMGNTDQPPVDVCTVARPGPGDIGPLYVYEGPDEHAFAIVAQLGLNRWVTVIGRDNDWYHIQDVTGLTGWVPVSRVAHNGLCQPNDGPGSLPLIENPGAPPANGCVASRPGQFPPPDIHLGPGRHFALIARLGNWAEVLQTEIGWHQILLGPGQVGWINGDDVNLSGPCSAPEPVPERIQFPPGATSVTLEGMLEPPRRNFYLFRAFAGQRATIEIVSEFNQGGFALSGLSDGQPYKRLEDELPTWSGVLPTTQDYLLTVAAPADAPTTGYRLFLTIEPLESPSP